VTDECNFTRNGIVNFHNCRKWVEDNPHTERPGHNQHRFSMFVCGGIIEGHLIGPCDFFVDIYFSCWLTFRCAHDNGCSFCTLVLSTFHSGCTGVVRQALSRTLDRSWSEAPVPWPKRSPDLNPKNSYLWGSMKNTVCTNIVDTRQ
jgi:hypothetical protein